MKPKLSEIKDALEAVHGQLDIIAHDPEYNKEKIDTLLSAEEDIKRGLVKIQKLLF